VAGLRVTQFCLRAPPAAFTLRRAHPALIGTAGDASSFLLSAASRTVTLLDKVTPPPTMLWVFPEGSKGSFDISRPLGRLLPLALTTPEILQGHYVTLSRLYKYTQIGSRSELRESAMHIFVIPPDGGRAMLTIMAHAMV
jgi:hypothetical protein